MSISVYDFDLTVTSSHSFTWNSIDNFPGASAKDLYEEGQKFARTKMKGNIAAHFKHDDEDHLSAIATYHNNPAFIAGFVSVVLGRELTLMKPPVFSATDPVIAIDYYTVAGTTTPFLISYIPASGDAFKAAQAKLEETGKNTQLTFLRENLLSAGLIAVDATIDFYDDKGTNVDHAGALPNTAGYLVSASSKVFQVLRKHREPEALSHSDAAEAGEGGASSGIRAGGVGGSSFFAGSAAAIPLGVTKETTTCAP